MTRGNHNAQFGAEYLRLRYLNRSYFYTMGQFTFTGTYTPQPPGAMGMFTATVHDGGEPGSISGDTIEIELAGGQFDGYANAGRIEQGNIQVF